METIIVKPRNKVEMELVSSLLKRMNIRSAIQKKEKSKKQKAKVEFLDSLEGRLNEVKQHLEGKVKLKDARTLLNEL